MKMAQKMMDGFIRDTICWQMNCLRSTVAGVYACRQLKACDAAQPGAVLPALCSGVHISLLESSIKMASHRMAKGSIQHNDLC